MESFVNERCLVITADDLGYNSERCDGIMECYSKGAITRTSLLVNGEDTERAAQVAIKTGIPLGLHFNMTEGLPVSPVQEVPSLLSDGTFYSKSEIGNVLMKGKINLKEVHLELKMQIEKFYQVTGSYPKYIDGHQHIHTFPGVAETFAGLLSDYQIAHTRLPLESKALSCAWLRTDLRDFLTSVVSHSEKAQLTFRRHGIKYTDSFIGLALMGDSMTVSRLQEAIKDAFISLETRSPSSSPHVVELMTHPGYPCVNDRALGCGIGADDFAKSADRKHELDLLTSPEMLNFYQINSIHLISDTE